MHAIAKPGMFGQGSGEFIGWNENSAGARNAVLTAYSGSKEGRTGKVGPTFHYKWLIQLSGRQTRGA
ncbi:MAG: hypothetical protein ACKO9Z_14345 [Planctomycetota bacterium]